jgi:hypothetical protein
MATAGWETLKNVTPRAVLGIEFGRGAIALIRRTLLSLLKELG